jgi:hypothetical protein
LPSLAGAQRARYVVRAYGQDGRPLSLHMAPAGDVVLPANAVAPDAVATAAPTTSDAWRLPVATLLVATGAIATVVAGTFVILGLASTDPVGGALSILYATPFLLYGAVALVGGGWMFYELAEEAAPSPLDAPPPAPVRS